MSVMETAIRDNPVFGMYVSPEVEKMARELLKRNRPELSKHASRKCMGCGKRYPLDETELVYSCKYRRMIYLCDECYRKF